MSLLCNLVMIFVFHTLENNDHSFIKQKFTEVLLRVNTKSRTVKIIQVPSRKFVYMFLKTTENKNENTKLKKNYQILITAKNEINNLI